MLPLFRFYFVLLCISACQVFADDSSPAKLNYFISPVSTDLQKKLIERECTIYAEINGDAFMKDGEFDRGLINNSGFIEQIKKLWKSDSVLWLSCYFEIAGRDFNNPKYDRFNTALEKYCRSAGITKVDSGNSMSSRAWEVIWPNDVYVEDKPDVEEPVFENEFVQVFPARTRLSKKFLGCWDCDCYVRIVPCIDSRMSGGLPKDIEKSITDAVQTLNIRHKDKILFQLNCTTEGAKVMAQLFNEKQPASSAMALAVQLGFKSIRSHHARTEGVPETLVGQPAPDFTLKSLNGEAINLHNYIKGRPAILVFCKGNNNWDSYLNQLHKKYGPQKIPIIAVYCYDHDKDVVESFFGSNKPAYPILIKGQTTAQEKYHALSEITYWLDGRGTIVDYSGEFPSGNICELKVKKLLATSTP